MFTRSLWRLLVPLTISTLAPLAALAQQPSTLPPKPSVVHKIQSPSERIEMTVNTSRILLMDQKISQAQVNNPGILEVTPLSPTQIQVSAKAAGVTQINLWGEDKKIFTVDVMVYGDAQELTMLLRSTFPNAALKVKPVSGSVMISGFVDKPEHIDRIVQIAEQYYPKVLNNMTVGGCQQVLLHVKVMEVSRTKLRRLGFDWAKITGSNVVASTVSGMVLSPSSPNLTSGIGGSTPPAAATTSNNPINSTFVFNVANGGSAFFGVLDALRQDNLLKIKAEPTLITVSGRAASFNAGGKIAVPQPGGLGTVSVEYKDYGTMIMFIPFVLGNGKIRLEVKPSVTELDYANGTTISGTTVPGFSSREVDTAVEMQAGQTLAIAGLVQSRLESGISGLPWISEVPYLGVPFRRVHETVNEVELLIMVTPELVEAMDANDVPPCGPGMQTTSPSDWELFMKGHLEVPNCCPNGGNCNGECPNNNECPDGPPPDGMILNPGEKIPTPQPADAVGRPTRNGSDALAQRQAAGGSKPSGSHDRHTPSKPNASAAVSPAGSQNGPPGFIGPVGYDVVK